MTLPKSFIENIQRSLGSEADDLLKSLSSEPVVSVRLNEDKLCDVDLSEMLEGAAEVPWASDAYYLSHRPQFTLDPLLHAGCYYVQDASSMFVERVLEQYVPFNSVVLDMCAAPGGKSTIISEHLYTDGLLISNEVVRQRVFVLSENMQKWGNGNTIVTHNKAIDFGSQLPNLFDAVLVDAPCSGEGMFRKDEEAVRQWSERLVKQCVERQQQILTDVWPSLKPGGILIYSTCTFNAMENEENALWAAEHLGATIMPVDIDPTWGITNSGIGYHFYPHRVKGEGFYICVLQKDEVPYSELRIKTNHKRSGQQIKGKDELISWLNNPDYWTMHLEDRFINAYPAQYADLVEYLSHRLICISTGIGLAEVRGAYYSPQHGLAMTKDFNISAFPNIELDLEQALNYLRSEAINLPNAPIGVMLLTYKNVPIGFVKNVGNHCNNMYPNEWRIRKL